jgi:PAS domain S-box-containing protein/diguanylate cyclase (GGDEF)-like protein
MTEAPASSDRGLPGLSTIRGLVLAFAGLFVAVGFAAPHHAFEGLASYLPLHNTLEAVSIVVAMLVFGITWNAYARDRSGNLVILASGLLAVGMIDFAHMLSFKGMPDFVTPANPEKAIDFWLAARLVFAVCLVAAAMRPAGPLASPRARHALLAAALVVTGFVYWLVLRYERDLPHTFIEGEGLTATKVAAEYFIIALLGVAAALFYARARRSGSGETALLFGAAALSILGELSFTLYSAVTDVFNLAGHVYKIVAFAFIYRAVFVASVHEPFQRLEAAKRRVEGSERYFRKLIHGGADVFLVLDSDAVVRFRSDSATRITGWSRDEVLGQKIGRFVLPADLPLLGRAIERVLRSPGGEETFELRTLHRSGAILGLEVNIKNLLDDPDVGGMIITARDITERNRAALALRKASRALRVLGDCNAVLLHAEHEQQLLDDICRLIVETGGYALAWVGAPERDAARTVRALAQHGGDGTYLREVVVTSADDERGRGPTGTAVRTGTVQVNQDFASTFAAAPWSATALRHGYRSSIALPLHDGPSVFGALSIYASEADAFHSEEIELLRELAENLAFGIRTLRVRTERLRADEELRFKTTMLETQQETTLDGVLVVDAGGRMVSYNRTFLQIWGIPEDVVRSASDEQALATIVSRLKDPAAFRAKVDALYEHPHEKSRDEIELIDGTLLDRYSAPMLGADGRYYGRVWYFRDVTQARRAEEALRESEERYRSIFERARDVVFIIGPDGRFTSLSPAFSLFTGWDPSEWIGERFEPIVHPDELARAREIFERTLRERVSSHFEMRIAARAGRYWDGDFSVGPVTLGGKPYLFGIGRDVTERKAQERRIERLTRVYAVLSGINAAIVRVGDRRQLFEEACRIAIEAGRFRMAWIGVIDEQAMVVRPVASGGEVRGFFEAAPLAVVETRPDGQGLVGRAVRGMAPVVSNDIEHDPQRLMKKECAERGILSLAVLPLVVGAKAVGVLCLYAGETGFFDDEEMRLLSDLAGDISFALDHIAKEEKVNYLAYYDVLTGLPNRAFFGESLDQQLQKLTASGGAGAVALGDVERFRNVNDTFGRPAADRLLCQIAERLKNCAGADVRLARVEADLFAFAIPDVRDAAQAAHAVERVLAECFARPFTVEGRELLLSMRLGIALFPADGTNADALYRNAEIALVKAKDATERYLFYAPDMNARVAETVALENKLRRAVEQRQFVLHYQPKVGSRTGRLVGLEALIRWNDPDTGLVPPARFIPVLEETGLILPVGEWALREAVAQHSRWRALRLRPPRIAVNVSAMQLRRKDFVRTVKAALDSEEGAEQSLDLEITESLIMANAEDNVGKLQELRAMGVHIAVDDFGTGYSSLRYIAQFPLDALKIDRSFIVRMPTSSGDMSIVSTIIALGHDLQLTVVAEGVDSEEQAKLLRLLRCDEMQGFLFSQALPAAGVEKLLSRSGPVKVPAPTPA